MDYLQYLKDMWFTGLNKVEVLNLIINGLPSIHRYDNKDQPVFAGVLNLIINGLPSILNKAEYGFYNDTTQVLNLIINGLPSILGLIRGRHEIPGIDKVLNLIINGLPSILLQYN